jgi:hypothetical protein
MILYLLVVFTVGLNVPYDDLNLNDNTINSIKRGQNSPAIISCIRNKVVGWPHFLNAFYIFSAFSTGVNGLYIASRLLHALASIRNVWPSTGWGNKIKTRLEKTSSKGVPVNAVFASWLFGLMGFMAVRPSPAKASLSQCAKLRCILKLTEYADFGSNGNLLHVLHAHCLCLHKCRIHHLQNSVRSHLTLDIRASHQPQKNYQRRPRRRRCSLHPRRRIPQPQRLRLPIQITPPMAPRSVRSLRLHPLRALQRMAFDPQAVLFS